MILIILIYIIARIIGIIIYQIIFMIVYIATKENDNVMSIMGMLVPFAIWNYLMRPIIYQIVLAYYRRNYNCYRFCFTKQDGTKDKSLGIFYANTKNIKNLSQNENNEYYVELVKRGKDIKSVPYGCEIYKGQEKFKGWEMNLFKNCE